MLKESVALHPPVSDLISLFKQSGLKELSLYKTPLSQESVQQIRAALPQCVIEFR